MAIKVLFLCTGNSARSIIAEALLRARADGAFDAHSAGTTPCGVHPLSVRVLRGHGIDASGLR
jgi:arsenate reductase